MPIISRTKRCHICNMNILHLEQYIRSSFLFQNEINIDKNELSIIFGAYKIILKKGYLFM
jgi:hypothetical protein